MPASYSLYELNEYINRVVALNFSEPIWVDCEIVIPLISVWDVGQYDPHSIKELSQYMV